MNRLEADVESFMADLVIAVDHPCLAGHFPGRPIVPAVLLLEQVAQALRERLCAPGNDDGNAVLTITSLANAKFLAPVLPSEPVTIHLAIHWTSPSNEADQPRVRSAGKARFRCVAGADRLAAQGEFVFNLGAKSDPAPGRQTHR